jgi:hypothetical protein
MSNSKRSTSREELQRIEDAWIRSILEASAEEIRTEIREGGDDPGAYVALADAMLAEAQERCGSEILERARAEATAFMAKRAQVISLEQAKAELDAMKREPSSPLTLAARKGQRLSERDEQALLRAKAALKRLESEDDTE